RWVKQSEAVVESGDGDEQPAVRRTVRWPRIIRCLCSILLSRCVLAVAGTRGGSAVEELLPRANELRLHAALRELVDQRLAASRRIGGNEHAAVVFVEEPLQLLRRLFAAPVERNRRRRGRARIDRMRAIGATRDDLHA